MGSSLQNRVTPRGNLEAVSARGTWLGNRGILHNERQQIVAPWRHKAWVTCKLEFKGRQRTVFAPRSYSELFFLDEATAFSAGHRPCGECRREKFKAFKAAWCTANQNLLETPNPSMGLVDKQLHAERAVRGGGQVTYNEMIRNLPDGAFVDLDGNPVLVWRGHLHTWTHHGYVEQRAIKASSTVVQVLTPISVVAALREGFDIEVHESAGGNSE
jgi:hypothetical protein